MSVFADTSALYALMVRTEKGHEAVVRAFRGLLRRGRVLTTTSYVVVETVALLQHRLGLDPVRDLDSRILPLVRVCWVSDVLHHNGMRRLLREDRRRLSLVDCISFEFMESRGIRDALTLDRDFTAEGFRAIP